MSDVDWIYSTAEPADYVQAIQDSHGDCFRRRSDGTWSWAGMPGWVWADTAPGFIKFPYRVTETESV